MTSSMSVNSPRPLSPLDGRTNCLFTGNALLHNGNHNWKASQTTSGLHRTQSFRKLHLKLDSSESFPSDSDSIYNADIVTSEESKSHTENTSPIYPSIQEVSSKLPSFPHFTDDSTLSAHQSHSRWPTSQLETIIERRSRSESRRHVSNPRLQPSPERSSRVIEARLSAHSIHPAQESGSSPHDNPKTNHVRSFSLNDLDCLPKSDLDTIYRPRYKTQSSSSSEEALRATCLCPTFPLRPVHAPPYRRPTPPGCASFSTKEAQEYRLTPSSSPHRAVTLLQRWFGRSPDPSDDQNSVSTIMLSPPISPPATSFTSSSPIAILRRSLGVSRLTKSPGQNENPRASLPPGIRIASSPGSLIQADDGTLVRGRWGARNSAHSVGQRGLDTHPLTRVAGLHSIDEMVREIDKACEAADAETQQHRTTSVMRALTGPSESFSEAQTDMRRLDGEQQTDCLLNNQQITGAQFPVRDQVQARTGVILAFKRGPARPGSISAPPNSPHMQEPCIYGSLSHQTSDCHDSVAGFHDYVEQGERERIRQRREQEKEDKSRCAICWEGFYSFYCCLKGRAPRESN